jgi:tetratricopeptide (TPR) repeat protein
MGDKMKLPFLLILLFFNHTMILPNSFDELISKGDSLYAQSDMQNALNYYEQAYIIDSSDYHLLFKLTRVCNDLGEHYYELHNEESSEKVVYNGVDYAERFYSLYPDSAKVYTYLAWSFGNQALFEGGKEKIKLAHKIKDNATKAISMDSTDYLPYLILGIYNRQIGALGWFERLFANTFFGDVPEGSFEESEKLMLKALELQPGIVIATFHLSLTYKEMGEEEKEIEMLKKVLELPDLNFRDTFAKRKAKERLDDLLD